MVWYLAAAVLAVLLVLLRGMHRIPPDRVGVVYRRFGRSSAEDRASVKVAGSPGAQAALLRSGQAYFLLPGLYRVRERPQISVPAGTVGVVVAKAGAPAPLLEPLARFTECDDFQDGRAFLLDGGQMGRQPAVLPGGARYAVNPELFDVWTSEADDAELAGLGLTRESLREVEVPVGSVGVVVTFAGQEPVDGQEGPALGEPVPGHRNFQLPWRFLEEGGRRGVQAEVLRPGSYRINPWFATVVLVPTRILIVEWRDRGPGGPPDLHDLVFGSLRFNVEGHWLRAGLTQTVSIRPETAPHLVQSFGYLRAEAGTPPEPVTATVRRFAERVLGSVVAGYLQSAAAEYGALELLASTQEIRTELAARIRSALSAWGVDAIDTTLTEFEAEDPELERTRRRLFDLEGSRRAAEVELRVDELRMDLERNRIRTQTVELEEQIRVLGRDQIAMERLIRQISEMKVPAHVSAEALADYPPVRLLEPFLASFRSREGYEEHDPVSPVVVSAPEDRQPVMWGRIERAMVEELARRRQDAAGDPVADEHTIVVYQDDDGMRDEVREAIGRFAESVGWEVIDSSDPIHGSWFQIFRIRAAKTVGEHLTADEVLASFKRAAELRLVHEAQAGVDTAQADAASKLIESLASTARAVALVGSILVVKDDGLLAVRTLSPRQLMHLERNPHITDPLAVLMSLREAAELDAPAPPRLDPGSAYPEESA
ncbi:SPFH domain-containing protein [Nonomuraea cavernae]|uniref:Band 7 domain-containing protein n=1 Tax=Nonomuraea cavernae TaxID=2045107 RepID=A0A918DIA7_9ACTN|nr:SPFH domain-containing protein [Nonomuraea cavernae]MCA2187385.1 SPFH domain-containing protein [Nonomuraea cavernae]GGO68461.1 hypothetical protein GCM10012289_27280 [Nonomuraea cavernae]